MRDTYPVNGPAHLFEIVWWKNSFLFLTTAVDCRLIQWDEK